MIWNRTFGNVLDTLFDVPQQAHAQTLDTQQWGFNVTAADIVSNVQSTLAMSIVALATMGFLLGALLYIAGGQKEELKNRGREFMFGAIIGIAIVMGVNGIVNLVMHFIYGS